jgi:ferredoxin
MRRRLNAAKSHIGIVPIRRHYVKVRVDPELCQGHTLCAMRAPAMFELSDIDGHAHAITEDVPADQEAAVTEAVGSCPEQAIVVF